MKLNYDCVRDVMLYLESQPYVVLDEHGDIEFIDITLNRICEALPSYSKEELYYTLFNLEQAGYIDATSQVGDNSIIFYTVNFITYEGHEFLERIKEPTIWEKTKSVTGKIGAASLSIISQIASDVIVKLVTAQI